MRRCTFSLGDFQTAELDVRADAIVAVESFAHCDSADAFFANAARHLREGGSLILADDFLAAPLGGLGARERQRVEELRSGWRVPAICTTESLVDAAAARGFEVEKTVDLTAHTRPGSRVRDRLVAVLGPLWLASAWAAFRSSATSSAATRCRSGSGRAFSATSSWCSGGTAESVARRARSLRCGARPLSER
jgi:SAM-dependent methyltransferase